MRKIVGAVLAGVLAGCGSAPAVTREDLEALKAHLAANQREEAAKLRQELTGVDQKYVLVQQVEQRVVKQLEEMARLQRELNDMAREMKSDVSLAQSSVLKMLDFEERLMAERLANLRELIGQLKPAAGSK